MGGSLDFYTNFGASYVDRRPVQVHNLAWVPSATIIDLRLGIQTDRWRAGVYGRNVGNNDSPTIATRWFSNPYIGTASVTFAGLALLKTPVPVPTANASYSLPRAFFGGFRRERQIGLEFTYSVGGQAR
jgi:hypothetical protein